MNSPQVYCPGGADSQSGAAVKERYPNSSIVDCGKIPDAALSLDKNPGPYVIPIWNSHQGEVKAAEYVWNHIQEAKIKIGDLWAKRIEFWLIKRVGHAAKHKKIGSVVVAKTQCSGFLAHEQVELVECALTTVAFDEYRKGALWDGVLVAPGQGQNETGFEVVLRETANPNNFTSFVKFVSPRVFNEKEPKMASWLTGVAMPSFGNTLGDTEQSFFTQLLEPVKDLGNIPKLIFVFKRISKVGLLFEGSQLHSGDLLDAEDIEQGDISIFENAGATSRQYTNELHDLFSKEFPALNGDDFILHQGMNTCLFACPPLGLYTHGYEVDTVEPVVRFYISRLFQRWDDGALKCTPDQTQFFKRHKNSWRKRQSAFMQFKTISATGN